MGIREEREEKDLQFVSTRNLLDGLVESEGVEIKEAAGWLLDKLHGEVAPRFLRRDSQSLACVKAGVRDLDKLLRYVSYWGHYPDSMAFEEPGDEEFNSYGWFRYEMADFLNGANITPPPCCSAMWKPKPKTPAWLQPFVGRDRITIGEAAHLLTWLDPYSSDFPDGAEDEISKWQAALIDASGREIEAGQWSMHETEQPLSHADIRAWCARYGHSWPVPLPPGGPAPAPESPEGRKLAEELEAIRAERDRLAAEVESLRAAPRTPPAASPAPQESTYSTPWTEVMQAAISEFFSPRRPWDAKRDTVVPWIESRAKEAGIADPTTIARNMFTIIKPSDHDPRVRR